MSPLVLAFLLASGDAAAGRVLFHDKGGCVNCHSIENRGGSVGPDLSEIGMRRTPESLRLALVDPDAEIYEEYFTVVAVTKQDQRVEGVALNEDDLSIQLRDAAGNPRSFLKQDLKEWRREERSLMPSYASKLSAGEIDDLVAYLRTLRGGPVSPASRKREIPRVTENLAWLTRVDRDGDERPETLLDALQIPPGATVIDLGAGAGYFTGRLSQRVGPRGKVIALDIQREMLDLIAKKNLPNVEPAITNERGSGLPTGIADIILVANAYHEFSEPAAMLDAVRRCLKPAGRLVVVEYAKENSHVPVSDLHKMSFEEIRSEIEPAGFELERVLDFLPLQHGLIFSRRR